MTIFRNGPRKLYRDSAHLLPWYVRLQRFHDHRGRDTVPGRQQHGRHRRQLPERDRRDAGQVRQANVRVRHAVLAVGHHRGQHAHRCRPVQAAHAHAHQRRAHVHGPVRHVHAAVPGTVAVLHVHAGQPLQTAVPGRVLLRVVRHERGHTHALPHRVHLAHTRPGRPKVSGFFHYFFLFVLVIGRE